MWKGVGGGGLGGGPRGVLSCCFPVILFFKANIEVGFEWWIGLAVATCRCQPGTGSTADRTQGSGSWAGVAGLPLLLRKVLVFRCVPTSPEALLSWSPSQVTRHSSLTVRRDRRRRCSSRLSSCCMPHDAYTERLFSVPRVVFGKSPDFKIRKILRL